MAHRPDVLFAHLGDPTGSSRALRQVRQLQGAGATVRVVGVGAARQPEALDALRMLPMPTGRGPAFFWAAHRAMWAALQGEDARVVHASDLHVLPAAAAFAARQSVPLVYDAREWYAGLDASAGRPWVRWLWTAVEQRWAPRADLVLTVNDAIADRLAADRGIARPTVVHNVADGAARPRTGALRRLLGLDDRPLALYQGLLRPGRGLAPLVDAFADPALAGTALVLIGEGAQEAELRARAAATAGRVHFVPFTPPDALAALTPDADLGVIVARPLTESLRMGLPNKLFEYAAAGLPVLSGAGIEPLRDAVLSSGAGEAVDPDDGAALVAALHRMLTDGEARAAYRAGLARLREAFSPEREAAAFLDAYAPLLAHRP